MTVPAPETLLLLASLTAGRHPSPQVRAFWNLKKRDLEVKVSKRSDLREQRKPKRRERLADPAARYRKLSVETGRTHPVTGDLLPPIEPWTGPDGSRLAFARVARAADGAYTLDDLDFEFVTWGVTEELLEVDGDSRVHMLSDASAPAGRKYPGAPVRDERAGIGRQLRHRAVMPVFRAVAAFLAGKVRGKLGRRGKWRAGGLELRDADICAAANKDIAKSLALDGYRFLSLSACRRVVKMLLKTGLLTEAEPPRHTRFRRSWMTIPRVFTLPESAPGNSPPDIS